MTDLILVGWAFMLDVFGFFSGLNPTVQLALHGTFPRRTRAQLLFSLLPFVCAQPSMCQRSKHAYAARL